MDTKEKLKSHDIHYTIQRASVYEMFKDSTHPLTVQEVFKKLNETVDLSTVYRTLELFEEKGLIIKTELKDPLSNIYEIAQETHTHHLICLVCKEIQLIDDCPLSNYEKNIMQKTGYIIKDHQLNLYGICPNCQLKDK